MDGKSVAVVHLAVVLFLHAPDCALAETIGFASSNYSVAEGSTVAVTIITSTVVSYVELHSSNGTALNGQDFFFSPTNITIDGQTSREFNMSIETDSILEKEETFQLHLILPQNYLNQGRSVTGINTTTIRISNSDVAEVNFVSIEHLVNESTNATVSLMLNVSIPTSFDFSVRLASNPGTAEGGFQNFNQRVSFIAGSVSTAFDVRIINDNQYRGTRMFLATFETLDPQIVKGNRSTASVTIQEDDRLGLKLERSSYNVAPGENSVLVKVLSNIPVFADVYVKIEIKRPGFTITHITASLYTKNHRISDGQREWSISVDIAGQDSDLFLEVVDNPPLVAVVSPSVATVTMQRSAIIEFGETYVQVEEGATVNLTVLSDEVFSNMPGSFRVTHNSLQDSAASGRDYILDNSTEYRITATTSVVQIETRVDAECEQQENFTLTLSSSDSRIELGRNKSVTVAIVSPPCGPHADETECPAQLDVWGYQWNETVASATATQACSLPNVTTTGLVSAACGRDGRWERSIVEHCEGTEFVDISRDIGIVSGGLSDQMPDQIGSAIRDIGKRIVAASGSRSRQSLSLFPFEIDVMNEYIAVVNEASRRSGIFSTTNANSTAEVVVSVISNALNNANLLGWEEVSIQQRNLSVTLSQKMLGNVETLSLLLGERGSTYYRANAVIRFWRASPRNQSVLVTGELFNSSLFAGGNLNSLKVNIPGSVISKRNVPVSVVVLRNLATYLSVGNSSLSWGLGSLLVSVNVNSSSASNLTDPITMTFPLTEIQSNQSSANESCVFWEEGRGWSTAGMTTQKLANGTIVCSTNHLTSFGVLVDVFGITHKIDEVQQNVLSVATYIGCAVSLLCLLLTIIFYLTLGKEVIRKVNNFVILNLSFALACGLLVFCVGIETATAIEGVCIFVTSLLHYLFLAVFCWTLCEAVLLYNMLVKVFGAHQRKWLYFYCALGWLPPLPIVGLTVGLSLGLGYDHYISEDGNILSCWLPVQNGLIWAFVAPMIFIVIINTVLLVVVLRSLYKSNVGRSGAELNHTDQKNRKNAILTLKATVILLPLLGLTWIIGLFAADPTFSLVFAYVFVALNVLQGLFIFIFHVVRHDRVWSKVQQCWSRARGRNSQKTSATTSTKSKSATTKSNGHTTGRLSINDKINLSSINQDCETIKDGNGISLTSTTFGK